MKKTLVIGAGANPNRYSYRAVHLLRQYEHEVVAIGLRKIQIADVQVETEPISFDAIHTVTLYLNPQRQEQYYDYILSLHPQRIIFNPGTENPVLKQKAKALGIEVVEYCLLVMLNNHLF